MSGRTIGLYLTPGYDSALVIRLEKGMRSRGAKVVLVGYGDRESVDIPGAGGSVSIPARSLTDTTVEDMDALVIPACSAGEYKTADEKILTLLIVMQNIRKPVGAIGNAPVMLAAAGLLAGRRVTGAESIRARMDDANAVFIDQDVVVDHKLVTARATDDVTHFLEAITLLLEPAATRR